MYVCTPYIDGDVHMIVVTSNARREYQILSLIVEVQEAVDCLLMLGIDLGSTTSSSSALNY